MNLLHLLLSLCIFNMAALKPKLKIGVLYYSPINTDIRAELLQNIMATYNCTAVEISGIAHISEEAYYKPRNRYRAPIILAQLNKITGYDKVIAITAKDISTTSGKVYDWGIMGLGSCPGKACVISVYRIKTANKILFNDRFIKIALHEIGHTIGLPHCTFSRTCFMEAASGTIKSVDGETRVLCKECKKLLNQLN